MQTPVLHQVTGVAYSLGIRLDISHTIVKLRGDAIRTVTQKDLFASRPEGNLIFSCKFRCFCLDLFRNVCCGPNSEREARPGEIMLPILETSPNSVSKLLLHAVTAFGK